MVRVLETVTHYTTPAPCKTAAEMEAVCCEETPALQCCEVVEENWDGYTAEEALERLGLNLDDAGRDQYGRYVVIEFEPRTKPCGERVTSYDTSPGDCCEAVADIVWDAQSSVDVIAPSGNGKMYFGGGRDEADVSVAGYGFWLDGDYTQKSGIASGGVVTIYADPVSCGAATVTIDDGCSQAQGSARSTAGHWDLVDTGRDVACSVAMQDGVYVAISNSQYKLIATRGAFETTQEIICDPGWGMGDCPQVRCTGDLDTCMLNYPGDCQDTKIAGVWRYKCHRVVNTMNRVWVC